MQSSLEQISYECEQYRCRRLVVASGTLQWAFQELLPWIKSRENIGWVGCIPDTLQNLNNHIDLLKATKPDQLLGFEFNHVIFNAHDGIYPDALAAISGTIKAGGLLILLIPSPENWPTHQDSYSKKRCPHGFSQTASPNFVKRLLDHIDQPAVAFITKHSKRIEALNLSPETFNSLSQKNYLLTEDQYQILRTILRHPETVHVITADRGRGKSYLAGQLAHKLAIRSDLNNGFIDNGIIYITGPNRKSVESVFKSSHSENNTGPKNTKIKFVPPERANLLNKKEILIVDEAASIPIHNLTTWAEHFNTIIFTSTTHGYEGTGKGFQVRFFDYLNHKKPEWQHHRLFSPIRYRNNDPLENWVFQALMLAAEPELLTSTSNNHPTLREISLDDLSNDEKLLESIFGLLINAHYQTRPSDLRDLLDAPGMRLFIATMYINKREHPICACLVTDDGPIEESLWEPICNGLRRPTGHLICQSLGFYIGLPTAMSLKGARILRIATLPSFQRKNIASNLLEFVTHSLSNDHYDFLGSSFAMTSDIKNFWVKNAFKQIKAGRKTDHASGAASALVIKALSISAQNINEKARAFFELVHYPTKHLDDRLPENIIDLLCRFAQAKGSVESATLIAQKIPELSSNQTIFLTKGEASLFRVNVKDWLLKNGYLEKEQQ